MTIYGTLHQPPQHNYYHARNDHPGENASKEDVPDSTWNSFWRSTWSEPINLFTAILALVTTILAVIAIFQSAMLIRADRTAQIAANAAKESTKISRQALIDVQRPFVFISVFETAIIGNEFRILPKWENGGTTAAMNRVNYVNWKTFASAPPFDYAWPDLDQFGNQISGKGIGDVAFIAPKATQYAATLRIPLTTLDEVREGKLRLLVWGWIEYEDILSEAHHRTEFCNEMVATNMGVDNDGRRSIAASFALFGPHNTAN